MGKKVKKLSVVRADDKFEPKKVKEVIRKQVRNDEIRIMEMEAKGFKLVGPVVDRYHPGFSELVEMEKEL